MGEAKDDTPKTMWEKIALLLFFVGWYVGNIYYNEYNKMALDGPLHAPPPQRCVRHRQPSYHRNRAALSCHPMAARAQLPAASTAA